MVTLEGKHTRRDNELLHDRVVGDTEDLSQWQSRLSRKLVQMFERLVILNIWGSPMHSRLNFWWLNEHFLLLQLGSVKLWNVGQTLYWKRLQNYKDRRNLKQPRALSGNFLTPPPCNYFGTRTRFVVIFMMQLCQVLLANIEIMNTLFFQKNMFETFKYFCPSGRQEFERSTLITVWTIPYHTRFQVWSGS